MLHVIIWSMDYEEKRRKQALRVLVAEVGMVISVAIIVVVAVMAAMGFFISSNGQIGQSGLVQLHSLPTGASVELDGSTLFARTNLSRTLSEGEHTFRIYRDGYDTWEKKINVYPGALMRLYYPRLFLQNRVPEVVQDLNKDNAKLDLEFYSPTRNREYILYALDNAPTWHLLDMRGDKIKDRLLDLSGVLPGMVELVEDPNSETAAKTVNNSPVENKKFTFEGKIKQVKWSANAEKVLAEVEYAGQNSWILINLSDVSKSLDLTETFGLNFERVEIIDAAANRLYVLENQHLRQIDAGNKSLSKVILNNVVDFSNSGSSVVYLKAIKENDGANMYEIGSYRDGEEGSVLIKTVKDDTAVKVALARFYEEDYICYTINQKLTVVYGVLPTYKENQDDEPEADLSELRELITDHELPYLPKNLEISPDGEYLVASAGSHLMVADLATAEITSYDAISAQWKWFDASMMYALRDGAIVVWDFDGQNQRDLSTSRAGEKDLNVLSYPVLVTANNRWLYYLTKTENGILQLTRERIWG